MLLCVVKAVKLRYFNINSIRLCSKFNLAFAGNYHNGLSAPKVIAKGKDLVALQIRHIARSNDVVIYEEPPLARALYASTEIGDEIPQTLFLAVARVLAYVFHLRRAAPTDYVPKPQAIDLPPEFADVMNEDHTDGD